MARIRIKSSYVPEAGCRGLGPAHGGDERNAIDDLDVEREGDALPAEVQDELIDELRVGDREAADDNAPDAGQKQGIDLLRRPESPRNLQLLRHGSGEFHQKIVLAQRSGTGAPQTDAMSPTAATPHERAQHHTGA